MFFQNDYHILNSHQRYMRGSNFSTSSAMVVVFLICISLMATEVECFFVWFYWHVLWNNIYSVTSSISKLCYLLVYLRIGSWALRVLNIYTVYHWSILLSLSFHYWSKSSLYSIIRTLYSFFSLSIFPCVSFFNFDKILFAYFILFWNSIIKKQLAKFKVTNNCTCVFLVLWFLALTFRSLILRGTELIFWVAWNWGVWLSLAVCDH